MLSAINNGYPIPARPTQLLQYLNLPGFVWQIIGLLIDISGIPIVFTERIVNHPKNNDHLLCEIRRQYINPWFGCLSVVLLFVSGIAVLLIFQGIQNRRKLWRNMDRCKDSIYQILAPTLSSSTAWQVVRRRTSRSPTISLSFLRAKHTLAIAGTGQRLKSPHPPQLVTAPLT